MQIVYLADNSITAQSLVLRLADAGIEAFVDGVHQQSAFGSMPIVGHVRIVCAQEDATRARELLLEWDKEHRSSAMSGDSALEEAETPSEQAVQQLYKKARRTSHLWVWAALTLLLLGLLLTTFE
jgi:hypothetical protein